MSDQSDDQKDPLRDLIHKSADMALDTALVGKIQVPGEDIHSIKVDVHTSIDNFVDQYYSDVMNKTENEVNQYLKMRMAFRYGVKPEELTEEFLEQKSSEARDTLDAWDREIENEQGWKFGPEDTNTAEEAKQQADDYRKQAEQLHAKIKSMKKPK